MFVPMKTVDIDGQSEAKEECPKEMLHPHRTPPYSFCAHFNHTNVLPIIHSFIDVPYVHDMFVYLYISTILLYAMQLVKSSTVSIV